jgi:ammonia channel protein AmtB
MATSPMHGYQQLGIFGAVGVLFSAAFALFILPLLVPIPKKTGQPPLWLTRLMEKFHTWQTRYRPWMLLALVALTVVAVFGFAMAMVWFKLSNLIVPLRVSKEDEIAGLDGPEMGVLGYPEFQVARE